MLVVWWLVEGSRSCNCSLFCLLFFFLAYKSGISVCCVRWKKPHYVRFGSKMSWRPLYPGLGNHRWKFESGGSKSWSEQTPPPLGRSTYYYRVLRKYWPPPSTYNSNKKDHSFYAVVFLFPIQLLRDEGLNDIHFHWSKCDIPKIINIKFSIRQFYVEVA